MIRDMMSRLGWGLESPDGAAPTLDAWGTARRAGAWLLAASVAGAALAVGTVHTATLCVVTTALAVATALTWLRAEPASMRPAATLLLVTAVGLTAYTALQCVPMPLAWLRAIAPRNGDIWARVLTPLRQGGPAWAPLSLDPQATRVEALKGAAYILTFVTSLRIVRRRGGVSFLSAVLVVTGVALALAALLHPAFGAHKLYGLIEPTAPGTGRHIAPFLNPNNLAGYLNIAFCIALAAAVSPDPRVPRPVAGSIALVLAATQVWVASRGGVAAMVLGTIAVFALSRGRSLRRSARAIGVSLLLAGALAVGAFMAVLGGSEDAASELLSTDVSFRVELFREALRMVPAYPVFGTGRGAFESTFPAFRGSVWVVTYVYPENVLLQWIIEWGLPFAIPALVAVAIALRPRAALARSTRAAGAWAAIVAVAAQNMVDLGTEIPGLMLSVVVCAAIVVGGTAGRRAVWRIEEWGQAPTAVAIAAVAAACAAITPAARGLDHQLEAERASLYAAAKDAGTSAGAMHVMARAAMLRHPAEPYLPFVVGWRAERARDDDPMPWLEATLERARVYATAHMVLGRLLARRSPSQARLEYRLAAQQAPEVLGSIGADGVRLVGGYYDAMELVPEGKSAVSMLELIAEDVADRLPATRVRLDAEIASRSPEAEGPALRAAADAIQDLEAGGRAPWCDGGAWGACVARALAAAKHAEDVAPGRCEPLALRARAEVAAGDAQAALADLASGLGEVADRVPCLKEMVRIAEKAGDAARTTDAIAKVADAACTSEEECADDVAWAATEDERRGKLVDALSLYKHAYEQAPGNDALLADVARLAARIGLHSEAADDYERLARKQPADARWKHAAETERNAL